MARKAVGIVGRWFAASGGRPALTVGMGAAVVGAVLSFGCGWGGETETLRTAWGEPDLMGVWQAPKLGARPGQDTFNLAGLEGLYRPDAREKMQELSAQDDPTLGCFPTSYPRAAALGWPIQILQSPNMLFVFNEAFHTQRVIPTNGRGHVTEDFQFPMFLGDSAGRWEEDTLVVDVISFNGRTWMAGGEDKPTNTSAGVWPTSDAMHVVERWRRVDADTLEYQARVEDPTILTGPWETPTVTFKRQAANRVQEAKCLMDDPASTGAVYLSRSGR